MTEPIPRGMATLEMHNFASSLFATERAREKGRLIPLPFPAVPRESFFREDQDGLTDHLYACVELVDQGLRVDWKEHKNGTEREDAKGLPPSVKTPLVMSRTMTEAPPLSNLAKYLRSADTVESGQGMVVYTPPWGHLPA